MGTESIQIPLFEKGISVTLELAGDDKSEIFVQNDAAENGEARIQLNEGCFYEYSIDNDAYYLEASSEGIISKSRLSKKSNTGRISPNIYVGTLPLYIKKGDDVCGVFELEVKSIKTSYRDDYRKMLGDISDRCIDLLMLHSSPVFQRFKPESNQDPKTLYQRFAFLKSILESDEFSAAVQKIIYSPVSKWIETETIKDIRSIRRFRNSEIRQLCSSMNRIKLLDSHPLKLKGLLNSIPSSLKVNHKTETQDTPENRFIKHALSTFLYFCNDIRNVIEESKDKLSLIKLDKEAALLEEKLETYLSHTLFKEVSDPVMLPLNSPVLQRKDGYREVLRTWLMFDFAAVLSWQGGEDVYGANKRNVAALYEYWAFFKLLDIISEVFKINFKEENLIEETSDGLGLKLKRKKEIILEGHFESEGRDLKIQFTYNKNFQGEKNYPEEGSWSRNMQPDYTLTIWPKEIKKEQAEKEEIIVHIHFDAKYKAEKIEDVVGSEEDSDNEKEETQKGIYKRGDLLKMHAYKDAIRRTAGAYVLYPGEPGKGNKEFRGFHELIPGLGAFVLKPSKDNNDGSKELKGFLQEVLDHFLDRASQREQYSFNTYDTFKDKKGDTVNEKLPEPYGKKRSLIPGETYVLVGYYRSDEQLEWIKSKRKYNLRTGDENGARSITSKETGARYLLLYNQSTIESDLFFKLSSNGPKVLSAEEMKVLSYPRKLRPNYLVFDLEEAEEEFKGRKWKVKNLKNYYEDEKEGTPFTVSLAELMKEIVKTI